MGIVELPWCGNEKCGLKFEELLNAKVLGVPYPEVIDETLGKCCICGEKAITILRVGRSY